MISLRTIGRFAAVLGAVGAGATCFVGCGEKTAEAPKTAAHDHDHAADDGHAHDHDHAMDGDQGHDDHDHGRTVELGAQTVGTFMVKASRDGELKLGGDAPIDVWITGGTAKVSVVRFWIGAEDGKGSMKAKAELEKDNWHTHAEVPATLAPESKLWVEIETDGGEKLVAGFDLKS